jgi:hypothetical protein
MGQAEILSAGTWRTAKTGDFIKPGDSVLIVGPGEVSLSSDNGKATVNLKDETLVSYDGEIDPNSRPWKDGQPVTATSAKVTPGGGKSGQFTVSKGQAEVVVVPGQPLRVVTPLIAAAVRGTHFTITVAIDGSSSLNTIEGQVLALGRNGVSQLVGPGGGFQLTSSQFANYLQQGGLSVPSGEWQGVDPSLLDKMDPQGFGDAVSTPGAQTGASPSVPSPSTPTPSPAAAPAAPAQAATSAATTGTATASGTIAQLAPSVGSALAMGGTGVATGSLTGEGTEAVPTSDVSSLPHTLTIIDPSTGQQTESFTTNPQGEFVMKIQGPPGQSEVAINVGGHDYLVELESGYASAQVSIDNYNFIDPSTYYMSTATITFLVDGQAPPGDVIWTVERVVNSSEPWWNRGPNERHGLAWGEGSNFSNWTNDEVRGTAPTENVAKLTDVVGLRTVTLKATTNIGGISHSETVDVSFGPGPLSIFAGPPVFGKIWADKYKTALDPGNDFSSISNNFEAANYCGGSVNNQPPDLIITYPGENVTFSTNDGSGWAAAGNSYYSALNSKLPSFDQLRRIADFSSAARGRGAARAAGWSLSQYWTSDISYYGSVFFAARTLSMIGNTYNQTLNNTMMNTVCLR